MESFWSLYVTTGWLDQDPNADWQIITTLLSKMPGRKNADQEHADMENTYNVKPRQRTRDTPGLNTQGR